MIINKYKKYTLDYILGMLEDAAEYDIKYSKVLMNLTEEQIQEIKRELEKNNVINKKGEVILSNSPKTYKILKEIERRWWHSLTEFYWIGYNVITESLLQTAQNTYQFNQNVLYAMGETKQNSHFVYNRQPLYLPTVKITDNYITNRYLKVPWCADNKVYSERLYSHVANFYDKLSFVLEQGVINGKGFDWMVKSWMKLAHQNANDATRLIKTETMALWSRLSRDDYLAHGIEYVEIFNPEACSEICSEYVGEVISLVDAELGDELPPYHPNCACCFCIYLEEEDGNRTDIEEGGEG